MEIEFLYKIFIIYVCVCCSITFDRFKTSDVITTNNKQLKTIESTALVAKDQSFRWQQHESASYSTIDIQVTRNDDLDNKMVDTISMDNMKAISQTNNNYWESYNDFLINEGSYQFWAIFQLATAALLIYSGFAALYYTKVNTQITEDYDDFKLKRRRRFIDLYGQPQAKSYFGLESQRFQSILDAVTK